MNWISVPMEEEDTEVDYVCNVAGWVKTENDFISNGNTSDCPE